MMAALVNLEEVKPTENSRIYGVLKEVWGIVYADITVIFVSTR